MGFGNLFKRKSVPEELPSLAVGGSNNGARLGSVSDVNKYKPLPKPSPQSFSPPSLKRPEASKQNLSVSEEDGYFKQLVRSVTEETKDLEKLESWYNNKFLPGDMVFQMREYWEKQQPELLMKNVRGDLKNKLMEKTDHLHGLEKEWQDIYFQLMSKENEIRTEEKELKDSLSEFMRLFKETMAKKKENGDIDLTKPK